MRLACVVAMDRARGIGKGGGLPWRLPGDMAFFRKQTTEAPAGRENAVVMGRRTFDSIPARFRPLPGRRNYVLSRDPGYRPEGATAARDLDHAVTLASAREGLGAIYVIGGGQVYAAAVADPRCDTLHVTRVDATLDCDVFFPAFEDAFERTSRSAVHEDGGLRYTFDAYRRG